MIGQMTKYKRYMEQEYNPVDACDFEEYVDIKGLVKYARNKGVPIKKLSAEEKNKFLRKRNI